MKKTLLLMIGLFLSYNMMLAQKYEDNWQSLDQRKTPEWFGDAKFGVFIHWGLYSVPGWSPAGTYTEWYQFWLQNKTLAGNDNPDKLAIYNHQRDVYGEESNYYDFAPMWKAELYDPQEWAELFKKSGAKYVVMTSKHHDGFTLWPSKHAQDQRGFAWNAKDVGPKKDLVGPYMDAMREAGLKAGLYYSLFEWYHPHYYPMGMDNKKFVYEHYHPQVKDLVTRYKPDLLYADGEWDKNDEYWRSAELIQWLYNESPCKDNVIINDRWFKGCRHNHGGFMTTEYGAHGVDGKLWEEIRGIGTSFGYNKDEGLLDYATGKQLVLMLCDIVSMGGNLCLNVGPRADGKIPVIQEQRLMEIGSWLDINGEAIYGTKKFDFPCQWSAGKMGMKLKKDGDHYITADYIERQTLYPDKGYARKEYFFTSKDDAIYVIMPKWENQVVIKNIDLKSNAKITLIGANAKCKWKRSGKKIIVTLPNYDPNWNVSDYAYVLKIK